MTKDKRVVLLMEPKQYDELVQLAKDQGVSIAEYIRRAIDQYDPLR